LFRHHWLCIYNQSYIRVYYNKAIKNGCNGRVIWNDREMMKKLGDTN
jgi:hypothetical protein